MGVRLGVAVIVGVRDGDGEGDAVRCGVQVGVRVGGGVDVTRGERVGVGVVVGVAVASGGGGIANDSSVFSTRIMTASATLYHSPAFIVPETAGAYARTESLPVVEEYRPRRAQPWL